MLLKISTHYFPATDLGFLLHKHPSKFQSVDLSVGKAHIFYPEKSSARTTCCLMLDIDPIEMVRGGKNSGTDFSLSHYVNDRPYVASSFMSVAIAKAFSSALNGKCNERPELTEIKLPFEITISALPAPSGGELLIKKLFEPLGYEVTATRIQLDSTFPDWGASKYYTVALKNIITTKDLLTHLYVLIPVLDHEKHYFVSKSEVDKLLEKGGEWLKSHPEREQIIRRYLMNVGGLARQALVRLTEGEENTDEELNDDATKSIVREKKESLHEKRLLAVAEKLHALQPLKVLDLGCGEGKLIKLLLQDRTIQKIAGMDVSYNELIKAQSRLKYDRMPQRERERIELFQGSLTYRDQRLEGYDAAAVVEVIEHLDTDRLKSFERVLFECARPTNIILTTPNREYNIVWENMDPGAMRHSDHRFEWTRAEFSAWCNSVCEQFKYSCEIFPLGEELEKIGAPSQMAVFTVIDSSSNITTNGN